MSSRNSHCLCLRSWVVRLASLCLVAALLIFGGTPTFAQFGGGAGGGGAGGGAGGGGQGGVGGIGFIGRAVGGVMIDVDGTLRNMENDDLGKLAELRKKIVVPPSEKFAEQREVSVISLKGLKQSIEKHQKDKTNFPQEILFLGGLQRIRYVIVVPEKNDILLVGPADGWKVDKQGNAVGIHTGLPVLRLDDLLVALRTAEGAANGGLSCSIDPTQEGLQRVQQLLNRQRKNRVGLNEQTVKDIEETLGPQNITLTNMPANSHFAQVLVAADYRMKRLGMNFDKSPVAGLPSYLHMVNGASANLLPRWWMAPNYEPMLRDKDGLTWELRGQGVRTLSAEDMVANDGSKTRTVKANPAAQKWAQLMTDKFNDLAKAEPVFGELRNVMDLSVVSALIVKENLGLKAGLELGVLVSEKQLPTPEFQVPKQVPSKVSFIKKGNNTILSASGGVEISSWFVADKVEVGPELSSVRESILKSSADADNWWLQ